ncbi:hypothetical protein [Mycobacterium sp. E3339]|uniref:hypothetical protein n=1 Tax=Mycobacterium sp. E3339 TaxID=1834146 RepID=UPI0012E8D4A5|nr:hypothetical protein [Mycobacterium sp. E3339]
MKKGLTAAMIALGATVAPYLAPQAQADTFYAPDYLACLRQYPGLTISDSDAAVQMGLDIVRQARAGGMLSRPDVDLPPKIAQQYGVDVHAAQWFVRCALDSTH